MTCGVSKRVSAIIGAKGKGIVFRHTVSTGGANPASNPVTGAIAVQANASAGASIITLTAPVGNWTLEPGDKFTIAGDVTVYTVGARTLSASSKFTNVPFSPVLTANATAGAAVTMTWTNDYPTTAFIGSYDARLIDGTTITVKDLKVMMQTIDTSGRTIPNPAPIDRVIIDGAARAVGVVSPKYAGPNVSMWEIQAKG